MDRAKRQIPFAQTKALSFLLIKIIFKRRKPFKSLPDQCRYLFILHALKQWIDRLKSSLQIVIILPGVHPRLFHIAQPSRCQFHDPHENALTARRQIFDHVRHIKKSQSAVARRVGSFEMSDGLSSGPDRASPSDHRKQNGTLSVLRCRRHCGQADILFVP